VESQPPIPNPQAPPLTPDVDAPAIQPDIQHATRNTQHASFRLRRAHLWIIAPLALIWIFQSAALIEPFDFWWNVTSGRIMVETGRFLGTDVLVYTPVREPYSNPQWGSQLLFYAVYSVSPLLLLTLRVAIVVATYGVLFAAARAASGSLAWAACATLAAYLTGFTNYGMRPQLFAFLPFIGFFWTLERAFGPGYGGGFNADPKSKIQNPKFLWLLPPLMIGWVNVHGSFFLGLILIAAYLGGAALTVLGTAAGRAWLRAPGSAGVIGRAALPLLATGAATLINPYTWQIYNYVLIATGDATARALNVEWQPPTLYNGTGILFFANVALFLATLLASRRLPRPTEALLWLAFGGLALLSIRNVIWWGWVTAPGLALGWAMLGARARAALDAGEDAPPPGSAREIPLLNWLLAGALALGALAATPLWRIGSPGLDRATPVALADFLATGARDAPAPPGPLFNYMEWGGYLEWRLYPQHQMFIDGRFEARQQQVWDDYLAISRGAATWQERLDRYQVRTLILNKRFHQDLLPLVQAVAGWRQVYEDEQALVFTRP
jgi:hypothetical protein